MNHPGRVAGGRKAAQTVKLRYGHDYHAQIGSKGGKTPNSKPKGFAAMPKAKVRAAGRKGGRLSDRTGVKHGQGKAGREPLPGSQRKG